MTTSASAVGRTTSSTTSRLSTVSSSSSSVTASKGPVAALKTQPVVDLSTPLGPEPERIWKPEPSARQSLLQQRKAFMMEQARRKFVEEQEREKTKGVVLSSSSSG